MSNIVPAAKAFIVYDNKILIVRESKEYKDGTKIGQYGEIGGRINFGEKFEDCLHREIKEETDLDVEIGRPFYVGEWRPVIAGQVCQIVATFCICYATTDKVVLSSDHDDYKWIDPKNYASYDIMDDLPPAFEAYLKTIGESRGTQKLVRDKIPEIISADGKKPIFHMAEDDEYKKALIEKLKEEVFEFSTSPSAKELADIYEVLDSLHGLPEFSQEKVLADKEERKNQRGGFAKKIILDKIEQ